MLKIWLMALACAGGQGVEEDEEDTTADDTGENTAPPTYPDGDRALIYYGHGGMPSTAGGMGQFDDVDARWKDQFSWNTDWKETLPEDLSAYRLIVLVAPGYTDSVDFDDKTVSALDAALSRGSRLAILAATWGMIRILAILCFYTVYRSAARY